MKNMKKLTDEQLQSELILTNAKLQMLVTERLRRLDAAMNRNFIANIRLKKTN
tara:strand:- start:2119 stop:2277 length:159 start_codon:yes stop_codon:yes gene_type:complete